MLITKPAAGQDRMPGGYCAGGAQECKWGSGSGGLPRHDNGRGHVWFL